MKMMMLWHSQKELKESENECKIKKEIEIIKKWKKKHFFYLNITKWTQKVVVRHKRKNRQ